MPDKISSASILQTAMTARDPARALLDLAEKSLRAGEAGSLRDIGVMLDGRFINLVRNDSLDELSSFAYAIVAFIDSENGDDLKSTETGRRLFHRWEHLRDLSGFAVENRDSKFVDRFVLSRKHGETLMRMLHDNRDGVRPMNLAKWLGISEPQLSKLLREFEAEDLVVRNRTSGSTVVRLGFMGKVYMAGRVPELSSGSREETCTKEDTTGIPGERSQHEGAAVRAPASCEPAVCAGDWLSGEEQTVDIDRDGRERIAGMLAAQHKSPKNHLCSFIWMAAGR